MNNTYIFSGIQTHDLEFNHKASILSLTTKLRHDLLLSITPHTLLKD